DHHVGAEAGRGALELDDDVVDLGEVHRLRVGEGPRLLQAVLELVDDDDPRGTHDPRGPGGEAAHRPGTHDDRGVALADVAELGTEVPGGDGGGEEDGVLVVHPVRDEGRADVGERHPDVL